MLHNSVSTSTSDSMETYGKVFLTRKVGGRDHGIIYAMKVLRKSRVITKLKHCSIRCPNVNFYVAEFIRGGELFTHLCNKGAFDLHSAKFYIAELVVAIDSVHKRKVVYRDLKLENVLLDENGHIKLTDFGLSKELKDNELHRANSYCGTIEYMAPEVVERTTEGYDEGVDWWSLGVIAFELLTGCSPFTVDGHSNTSRDIAKRILTKPVPFPRNFNKFALDFISRLLEKSARRRLGRNGVDEIKNHLFLVDINWQQCERRELEPPIVPKISNDLDVTNFAPEFTNQMPVYSPADTPFDTRSLFRGYSFVSPSVMFANNNIIGEECLAEDFGALVSVSSFFSKYKLDRSESGLLEKDRFQFADGVAFAVKIVSQRFQAQASREASILNLVSGHPNIVRLIDVQSDSLHIYLIMELLEGGELLTRIKKMETFTEAQAGKIMKQLVSAVAYLHFRKVVHRDLKPENILFESNEPQAKLRLVDFGFARLLPSATENLMTPCFTLHYAAPEVLESDDRLPQYNEQCDLWSLGVILFTMLSGNVPFHARSKYESATDIMKRIRNAEFSFDASQWRSISAEAKTLITLLLTVDPTKRLSLNELQCHPWLLSAAAQNETPLQTPTTLLKSQSHTEETFNETLNAFLNANRAGFHLMEVAAAPLLVKRRGMKRKSFDSREPSPGFESTTNKKVTVTSPLETVPEVASPQLSRPSLLFLQSSSIDYRNPKSPMFQDTEDST
ncbi:putative ribosomal protein S6 kinase alpha-2 [Dirofilaria immitis]|nr:putative ribosomal protein S6 kinase alpha-2 [Dirofilaria immitis]